MALVDITESRRKCLHELGLRGHFVEWVKDALEGESHDTLPYSECQSTLILIQVQLLNKMIFIFRYQ